MGAQVLVYSVALALPRRFQGVPEAAVQAVGVHVSKPIGARDLQLHARGPAPPEGAYSSAIHDRGQDSGHTALANQQAAGRARAHGCGLHAAGPRECDPALHVRVAGAEDPRFLVAHQRAYRRDGGAFDPHLSVQVGPCLRACAAPAAPRIPQRPHPLHHRGAPGLPCAPPRGVPAHPMSRRRRGGGPRQERHHNAVAPCAHAARQTAQKALGAPGAVRRRV
mmetsp:Transcript_14493/g.35485  ORF Transcript_14493/g.35485 Transcript_14493/m.35485 type:complete len:222 (-) Transcript_14493:660-1325(-)